MKIEFWTDPIHPPEGFEMAPAPSDFGVGRSAHCGAVLIQRGDAVITHADGRKERLGMFKSFEPEQVLALLKEVARDGLEIIGGG
jgi:hypothetical protein